MSSVTGLECKARCSKVSGWESYTPDEIPSAPLYPSKQGPGLTCGLAGRIVVGSGGSSGGSSSSSSSSSSSGSSSSSRSSSSNRCNSSSTTAGIVVVAVSYA